MNSTPDILTFNLGSRTLSKNSMPYIIAEIGVNHNGSINQARELIKLAKKGGADAVKFQSYKAEKLASKNSPSYWDITKETTISQYKLFKKYDSFGIDDYVNLYEYSKRINIDFLSTPFDDDAIDFLEPLVPCYKISSSDITNLPFLRKIGHKNKEVILSTGASSLEEIDIAVRTLNESGSGDVALLHCILNYPTNDTNAHLNMITGLRRAYPKNIIGYSDHTLPDQSMSALTTAYLLGAVIIEKHFTYNKALEGNDHYHSMDLDDLDRFVFIIKKIHELRGATYLKQPIESETISRLNARRSIVSTIDIDSGQIITENNISYKRPGTGISPLYWDGVIGKRAVRDLKADQLLEWDDIA